MHRSQINYFSPPKIVVYKDELSPIDEEYFFLF